MQQIVEWQAVDAARFHDEIVPSGQPAILRNLVGGWPGVAAGRCSAAEGCRYLQAIDLGQSVYTIAAPPEAHGRFFYRQDLKSFNFKSGRIPLSQVLDTLLENLDTAAPPALAAQALPVTEALADFATNNPMPLLDAEVLPTMWIGNKARVSPHYDVHRNLACVMAGRREFTLFPPEQVQNLYPGPVLDAPGGVPISLVDVENPDLARFPRYEQALAAARRAVLEPGDAIFIPSLWWHGVSSLESFNVLVNYWWGGHPASGLSPNDSLLHTLLTISALDSAQREAWRSYFDYYVFRDDVHPGAHLPEKLEDILTSPSPQQVTNIREFLARRLTGKG